MVFIFFMKGNSRSPIGTTRSQQTRAWFEPNATYVYPFAVSTARVPLIILISHVLVFASAIPKLAPIDSIHVDRFALIAQLVYLAKQDVFAK